MKNLRTLITIFVLSFTVFSCQTDNELNDFQSASINAKQSSSGEPTIEILVQYYNERISPEEILSIRNRFENYLNINSHFSCGDIRRAEGVFEVWVIDYIPLEDFNIVLRQLNITGPDDRVIDEEGDDDPEPEDSFRLYYDHNCDSSIY